METTTDAKSQSWKGWLAGALAVLAALGISWPLTADYTSEQTAERSFVIDQDFTKVRKIMVRTNAAKEIITLGGTSEFVEQHWEEGTVQSDAKDLGEALWKTVLSADPGWKIDLKGTLKVRTLDDYVGREVVTLEQVVSIDPNALDSQTRLREGSRRLIDYAMTTRLEREEDHTRVHLKLNQGIRTNAPWFAHGIADRRVLASAATTLEKQEAAMQKLIEDNKDKNWLFPLN
jgi:hypothetical protein